MVFEVCHSRADSMYYPESSPVACPATAARYCKSSKFTNLYADMDMEFFEGDIPQAMFGLWWKEKCTATTCNPELTCAGTSG